MIKNAHYSLAILTYQALFVL